MKTAHQRLEEIKSQGYDLDFGETFNDAFEVYKRTALMSGLAMLLFTLILGALSVGIIGVFMGFESYMSFVTDMAKNNMSIVGRLLYITAMCVIAGLTNPFSASLIKMAGDADRGDDVSVGDAFRCYKPPYFAPLFAEALLVSFFSVGITTAIQMAFPENTLMSLVGMFINLFITFVTVMAAPLIIFGNFKAVEAIQGSFAIVLKSPFVIAGLLLVSVILACVGFIGFCIGVFFTVPFLMAMYYCIYKNSVGIDDANEIEEIGSGDF